MNANAVVYDPELCHVFSRRNRESIAKSKLCGCFRCIVTFPPAEVKYLGDTGTCPHCGADMVVADFDVPIMKMPTRTRSFLETIFPIQMCPLLLSMHQYWVQNSSKRSRPL